MVMPDMFVRLIFSPARIAAIRRLSRAYNHVDAL